jgi:hypothetical protein
VYRSIVSYERSAMLFLVAAALMNVPYLIMLSSLRNDGSQQTSFEVRHP